MGKGKCLMGMSTCLCCNEVLLMIGSALLLIVMFVEMFDWDYWFGSGGGGSNSECSPQCPPACPACPCPPKTKPCCPPPCRPSGCCPKPCCPPKCSSKKKKNSKCHFRYGYEDHNGPLMWKSYYEDANTCYQSPINILTECAQCCNSAKLMWSTGYGCVPTAMRLKNDGRCLILNATFCTCVPYVCGGPLQASYELHHIRFRWGPCDDEGSEHTVDNVRYAMEMQCIHVKTGCCFDDADIENELNNLDACGQSPANQCCPPNCCDKILIISYIFKITCLHNVYLEHIVTVLRDVEECGCEICINPFPIVWLMPTFSSDYFFYEGSLSYPPCTPGVLWMVQPEPIAISSRQLRQFRKLRTPYGPMLTNTRPIQDLNCRDIFYISSPCDPPC